ncbi:AsmA family protein [Xylophilus sp.]|uniref:AsmA family protein n=1 Tax=Xylophilus sp. TaxID=2653893 RepID=UPI0013B5B9E5|nr:AsmA family protein [Xylophilus sp.]KAF1043250.1 MAG: hypothetical protein GAK38_04049 [Xylophilus sp.]
MPADRLTAFPRRHPIWTGLAVLVLLLIVFFDWNWFRHPLERYLSNKTHREFRISDLHVKLGFTPTIRMRDVYFSNADWSKQDPMARIKQIEFSISLRDLPQKILVPRVALTEPDFVFERLADDRKNWIFSDPNDKSPSKLRISTLSVDQGRLRYFDHGEPFTLDVHASTFDPEKLPQARDADAKPQNNKYSTRYTFTGSYHGSTFEGKAQTGEVLSFQESGVPFPVQGELAAGTTKLWVEGTIADAAKITGIDTRLRISGQTLANLYPFLLLPLPASPPYSLAGHLVLKGDKFTMDDLAGKIGSTDVSGSAGYLRREPRPLLTADLHSKLLDVSDLGPLVGVQTKETGGKPRTTQAQTRDRPTAKVAERTADPDHILPAGSFDGSRLQKIDAKVDLDAKRLKVPVDKLPLESMRAALRLDDAVLKLQPLEFGFAGGSIVSQITLDARQPTIDTHLDTVFRGIQLARLLPQNEKVAQGVGRVSATVKLHGRGNSIADAAAKVDGRISAAVAGGRVSNLLDAVSGLNGGKIIQLLVGGDRTINVRCGGTVFDVKEGRGTSSLFVVDTEQTEILGNGSFDLENERFDLTITPRPKRPGILSLRTPVRVYGRFNKADFELYKGPLIARAGGALALAAVAAPLAALAPLIETGPGESVDCGQVEQQTMGAQRQAAQPAGKAAAKRAAPTK